jgi:hypothetical protein
MAGGKDVATKKKAWPLTKIVEVSWFDANARGSWASAAEYMQHSIAPVLTTGYLLKQDKKEVIIVQSQGADWDDCNGAIAIPLSWIAGIKVLRK